MQAEEVRRARRAAPFRPFVIHLADGRRFTVDHPELVFVTTNGRTIVLEDTDGGVYMLDTLMVTGLDFDEPRAG